MRLTDLVWAVTAFVGVSCVFAQGKDTQHISLRRRLHYDANPKHIPIGKRDRITYDHMYSRQDAPNEIYISTYEGSKRRSPKRPESHKDTYTTSEKDSTSLKQVEPFSQSTAIIKNHAKSPESRKVVSSLSSTKKSSTSHSTLKQKKPFSHTKTGIQIHPTLGTPLHSSTGPGVSKKKSKHPSYSTTTFKSFDSFLNAIGTSFKIADDTHSTRARTDTKKSHLGAVDQPHIPLNGFLNDQQISQDLYESNALGIDVLEQDKATLLNMPERCCGSKVPIDMDSAKNTGKFDRVAAAGSIKVVEVPEEDTDLLPPSAVRDLKISVTGLRTIMLTWTAPGDDLDSGKVSRYIIRLTDTRYDLRERRFDQASSYTELNLDDLFEASGVYKEAGTKVKVTVNIDDRLPVRLHSGQQYYLAFRSVDDFNNTSPVSNVATFTLPVPPTTTSTTTTTTPPPPPTTTTTSTTTTTTTTSRPLPITTMETYRAERTTEEYRNVLDTFRVEDEQSNQIVATLEGRVIQNPPEDQPRKSRKERRKKNKGKKNRRRKEKGKGKKVKNQEEQEAEPFDSYKYPPGCLSDNGQSVTDGKLCDAISALLTVIDYFEQTREYKHLDYLSSIVVTLRNRAQPHWRID